MIKEQIQQWVLSAVNKAYPSLETALPESLWQILRVEQPRTKAHGDFAVNISPLSKQLKLSPPAIAQTVAAHLPADVASFSEVSCVGGFLNFTLTPAFLASTLHTLLNQPVSLHPVTPMAKDRIHLEYVSANPTGPLHIGHGRWAALGDSLRRLFEFCGAQVVAEFYVNDYGNQMDNIAHSLWYRCLEQLGWETFPLKIENQPYPFYPGEYVVDLATAFLSLPERKQWLESAYPIWKQSGQDSASIEWTTLKQFAKAVLFAQQKSLLEKCRVRFDVWTMESDLHLQGRVSTTLQRLKDSGDAYESEGALWFKSSALGDEKDRVLVKSDGSYTYLTADIAYHDDKFLRPEKFNHIINIWGADHHGYIPRMAAAVAALGHNSAMFEVVLGQLVNLIIDGEKNRMGKRRSMLTLADVVEEVGVDATRFWMVLRSQDTALDFDVDLAASSSDENPVFYVQYAHARCASILRNATEPLLDILTQETRPAILTNDELSVLVQLPVEKLMEKLFAPLSEEVQAGESLKALILQLSLFPERALDAAKNRSPHIMARYLQELAGQFHGFYNAVRVLNVQDAELTKARLTVIVHLKATLKAGLDLLGVSAPEKM